MSVRFPDGKTLIVIDGANLHGTLRSLGYDVDYSKLLTWIDDNFEMIRVNYYTAILENGEVSLRPLIDFLDYNGFNVITKSIRDTTDRDGRRRIKGNMDVEISVDTMELAPHFENLVLFSGDGDLVPLVKALQRQGKRVVLCSTTKGESPVLSDELRRGADHFVDVSTLRSQIERPQNSR